MEQIFTCNNFELIKFNKMSQLEYKCLKTIILLKEAHCLTYFSHKALIFSMKVNPTPAF